MWYLFCHHIFSVTHFLYTSQNMFYLLKYLVYVNTSNVLLPVSSTIFFGILFELFSYLVNTQHLKLNNTLYLRISEHILPNWHHFICVSWIFNTFLHYFLVKTYLLFFKPQDLFPFSYGHGTPIFLLFFARFLMFTAHFPFFSEFVLLSLHYFLVTTHSFCKLCNYIYFLSILNWYTHFLSFLALMQCLLYNCLF